MEPTGFRPTAAAHSSRRGDALKREHLEHSPDIDVVVRAPKVDSAHEPQLTAITTEHHENGSIDFDAACEILKAPPDLGTALAAADPHTRRRVFDAFRLSVTLDRNAGQIHVTALISSAFTKARDLQQLVANGNIAGAGFDPISDLAVTVERAVAWPPWFDDDRSERAHGNRPMPVRVQLAGPCRVLREPGTRA